MTSLKTAFMLLALLGVLSAFNVSGYLYSNETGAAVTYSNFSLNGTDYSLVDINGVDSFLLQNDAPVTNASVIEPLIQSYYMQTYYPTSDQLAELSSLITLFNVSRNAGYDYPGEGEYACRDDVIFNGKTSVFGTLSYLESQDLGTPITCTDPTDNTSCSTPLECVNNASCTDLSQLVGQYYCQQTNILCDPNEAYWVVANFSLASYDMDNILGNYTAMLGSLSPDTVASTMDYIQSTAPNLLNDTTQVESSELRTPRSDDPVGQAACMSGICYALCPSMNINISAAAQIASLATNLSSQVAPLADYQNDAAQLVSNTESRLDYASLESTDAAYSDTFDSLNVSGTQAIALGQQASSHVSNMTLTDSLDELMALQTTIPEDLQSMNLTTTQSDLSTYSSSTASVDNLSRSILGVYNSTLNAKNTADSLMLLLQTENDLSPGSLETFGVMQNRTSDLDASFRNGYTVAQLETLQLEYANVSAQAQALINSQNDVPAAKASVLFQGFARRVNAGIASSATGLVSTQSITGDPLLSFGSFSALVFLSFAAILLLVFLYLSVNAGLDVPQGKYILGAALASLLVLLLGFSVFLYLFLDRTATNATFTEFLSDFNSHNSTSIVLDLQNVSDTDSQPMISCANSLSGVFKGENKTLTTYTLSQGSCTAQPAGDANLSADNCIQSAEDNASAFVFAYSPQNEPPQFSITYKSEAYISGNPDYYASCPLATLFG